VAGVGQQALVRTQQGLDACCGAVEAARQRRHFVAPVFGHALVQGAGTKSLDAELERFEPPGQSSNDGQAPAATARKITE
jgi:hypothetical protein